MQYICTAVYTEYLLEVKSLWKYDNLYATFDFAIQKTDDEISQEKNLIKSNALLSKFRVHGSLIKRRKNVNKQKNIYSCKIKYVKCFQK